MDMTFVPRGRLIARIGLYTGLTLICFAAFLYGSSTSEQTIDLLYFIAFGLFGLGVPMLIDSIVCIIRSAKSSIIITKDGDILFNGILTNYHFQAGQYRMRNKVLISNDGQKINIAGYWNHEHSLIFHLRLLLEESPPDMRSVR